MKQPINSRFWILAPGRKAGKKLQASSYKPQDNSQKKLKGGRKQPGKKAASHELERTAGVEQLFTNDDLRLEQPGRSFKPQATCCKRTTGDWKCTAFIFS